MKKKSAAKAAKKTPSKAFGAAPPGEPPQTPVVGVGASAGGLEAFTQLLGALPTDTGMAFVLVQHLEPKHESVLPKLLQKSTKMPVLEVREGIHVEPDKVYVIPANADMSLLDGLLHIVGRKATAGHHLPIDSFFISLAEARGAQAVGVILSGAASDGTVGFRAIKKAGGITIAQAPESAKFDGMPRSAIASGCVDLVLPPDRIAHELGRMTGHLFPGLRHGEETPEIPGIDEDWARLFRTLRRATGIDFGLYKPSTIKRRVARRMAVCKLDNFADYVKLLRQNPREVSALFGELLILVTEFFRDPEVYEILRLRVFPKILAERVAGEPIRIWVAGCSTGEEPYSVAITLLEALGERAAGVQVQIFATDVSEEAIDKARTGVYTAAELKGVTPEKLRRFFTPVNGHYQVNQPIREMCLFARHDLTRDPPFSKLDLITCRNVLIYMEAALQKRILAGFHWALKPSGYLMLGKSESLGANSDLFTATNRANRFFRKSVGAHVPVSIAQPIHEQILAAKIPLKEGAPRADVEREVDQALWERAGFAGLVVNNDLQILHVRGDTSPYVRLLPGKASLQLMRALREEIVLEVRAALQKARQGERAVRSEGIEFPQNGHKGIVNIEVRPLIRSGREKSFLILFEQAGVREAGAPPRQAKSGQRESVRADREASRLRDELARTRDYVKSIIRDQEATNEELKTANEEALSSMEELQSTNEELETAKEELQSSNEELVTLNEQLQNRNAELSQTSSDLGNILSGIDIPVVILDTERRIRRFTPPAEKLLGLIAGDIGRPIGKLRIGINIPPLDDLISAAFEKGATGTQQVQSETGRWYALRIHPDISGDGKVRGVLMTFVDIDEPKKIEEREAARANVSEATVQAVMESAGQAILAVDRMSRIVLANATAETMFGYARDVLLGKPVDMLLPQHLRGVYTKLSADWFRRPGNISGLELTALRKDGTQFPVQVNLSSLVAEGETRGVAFVSDISDRRKAEQTLSEYRERLTSEVAALGRLRTTAASLWQLHNLQQGLEQMIDAGRILLAADFGNIQLLNQGKQVLEIVAQRGFQPEFLEHFREVSAAEASACGRSLRARERTVIEDVNTDPDYAPHRMIAAAAGYRAVQSTPLFGSDGQPIGMFSTHFRNPHRPPEEDLARFDLYANQAAQFIERMRADEQMRRLSGALLSMQETGNREIARELHDVFSQELAAVGMDVSALQDIVKSDGEATQRLADVAVKIGNLSNDIHRTARELHPAILEDLGLEPALRQECDSFQQRTGIRTEFRASKIRAKIAQDAALCLYRLTQEALRNVHKHSKSPTAKVRLEEAPGGISLRVEDAGKGFDVGSAPRKAGLGLVSMEERTRLVNGTLTIESRPGSGTTVAAFVPLRQS